MTAFAISSDIVTVEPFDDLLQHSPMLDAFYSSHASAALSGFIVSRG